MIDRIADNTPAIPLPNPGEGGPVAPGPGGTPVIPLPNPGEGGPVAPGPGGTPVIPLPNPGEGGPVAPGPGGTPVIPLPNPGEGGPVAPGPGGIPVIPLPNPGEGGPVSPGPSLPQPAKVRFFNATYGYQPFRVYIDNQRVVDNLSTASTSKYMGVYPGYHTVTITGPDGYIYIQKSVPFTNGQQSTIAIFNTMSGLDFMSIPDHCCPPTNAHSNFRVANLAYNSNPLDVILSDGRVIFGDVQFKEVTSYKRIRPGNYEFFFAETDMMPMPIYQDIEVAQNRGGYFYAPATVGSLYFNVRPRTNYTAYIMTQGAAPEAIQVILLADG